jgi:hypothetical protein
MLLEADGILAMLIILAAYAGTSSGYLTPRSPLYQALNLVGSLMFVVYLSVKHAWPSVVLNAVWAAIALVVLIRRAWSPVSEKPEQSA